ELGLLDTVISERRSFIFLNIRNVFSMHFTNPKKIRNRLLFCLVLDLILYRVFPSVQRKDWPKQFTAFFIFSNKVGHVVKRGKGI
ncbi:MAG: hypothetical protein WBL54_07180, partial [Nitrososphaeraceae archaeon]